MATAVPLGNVEILKRNTETNVFVFEIGAASLPDVAVEASNIRKFVKDGRFLQVRSLTLLNGPTNPLVDAQACIRHFPVHRINCDPR